jgi:cytochrome P450
MLLSLDTIGPAVSPGVPPGPRGLPLLGSAFDLWRDPLGLMMRTRATYGDIAQLKAGPLNYLLVTDPDAVRHVLVDNAKAYRKGRNYLGLKLLLGEGLLTNEAESWRRQRKLAQPAFHRARLAGFADHMSRETRRTLAEWGTKDTGTKSPFCVHEELMRLTFRIVGRTLFSADVDGEARDVGQALNTALHWANDYVESFFPVPPSIPTPANVRFKRARSILDRLVYQLIADRRTQIAAGKGSGVDLLGMLMEAVDDGTGQAMSDQQLRDEIITMVLAGHETTANLLAWTFMLLARHPEIERRVREEAIRVLGDRDPALEDVRSLEYTERVLEEVLRLYPPAWVVERQNVTPDVVGGYPVPRESIIAISPYVIHRNPSYWDDPETFDPERFRPERVEARQRYTYLPFGGGARVCIGNHFAMMEAQIILAMIVRETHLSVVPGHPIELDAAITLRPKHGLRVTRTPANSVAS